MKERQLVEVRNGEDYQPQAVSQWRLRELLQFEKDAVEWRARVAALEAENQELRERRDAAYEERNRVVAVLSKLWPSHVAKHPEDDETWDRDWLTIVCIHSPVGQLTWHVHDSQLALFGHLLLGENHWDGHTTAEKYQRLSQIQATDKARLEAENVRLRSLLTQIVMAWDADLDVEFGDHIDAARDALGLKLAGDGPQEPS